MLLFGILWIASLGILVTLAIGYAATIPLMRRRVPDPADHPSAYGMAGEEVSFPSRDGLTLGGWWIPAQDSPRGTIIMCPGQNGSLDKDIAQAAPLHRARFNVLMFDFRGHGRSEGQLVTIGALEQADLFGALDYLAAQQGIERVGVLGFSMGSGVTLMVAAQDQRIAALVVDGAYPRLSGLLMGYLRAQNIPTRLLTTALAWLTLVVGSMRTRYQIYRANPVDLADRIKAPALFIHGDLDPFVTPAEVETVIARLSVKTELWRVPDAGHREAYNKHPDEYNRRVVAWFEKHLVA
jgi:dipeptidyl aminopeptidase/acylaminoacyl peptidase